MADLSDFAAECEFVSKKLRRIDKDLRRALAAEVKTEVAIPLAQKISQAASGPYGPALSGAVKARAQADPTIVIGGSRKIVHGGANARQLVFGTEFGGGKRITAVPRNAKHKGYKRRSTNQFVPAHPFVFSTIGRNGEWVLDQFSNIVMKVLEGGISNG